MRVVKKSFSVLSLLIFTVSWCFGQVNFSTGENLFMHNKPAEAKIYLENAIIEDPSNIKAYLYLGIVYEQLNMADEAIAVYRQILDHAGDLTANVANNLGNAYFKKDNITEAEAAYTRALELNRLFPTAYLGRANARIKRGLLREAVTDYEQYLLLDPYAAQRSAISNLVALIKAELAEAERQRLIAEEKARAEAAEAERQRLIAEEKARIEAEQRQQLLDEIASSLNSAAQASKGLSSGLEPIEGYAGEFELE